MLRWAPPAESSPPAESCPALPGRGRRSRSQGSGSTPAWCSLFFREKTEGWAQKFFSKAPSFCISYYQWKIIDCWWWCCRVLLVFEKWSGFIHCVQWIFEWKNVSTVLAVFCRPSSPTQRSSPRGLVWIKCFFHTSVWKSELPKKKTLGSGRSNDSNEPCRKPLCPGLVIPFCFRAILRIASARTRLAYASTHGQTLASASLTRAICSAIFLDGKTVCDGGVMQHWNNARRRAKRDLNTKATTKKVHAQRDFNTRTTRKKASVQRDCNKQGGLIRGKEENENTTEQAWEDKTSYARARVRTQNPHLLSCFLIH